MQPWQNPALEETRTRFRTLAKEKLSGDWRQRDADMEFSRERWQLAADEGIFGLSMPEQYGGKALPFGHTIAGLEGLCEGSRDTGMYFAMASQISGTQLALMAHGSDSLKEKYLPALISGKHLTCLGFSEMGAGSDVYSIQTRATKTDNGWIIDGAKAFTTNSLAATCCLVFARTDDKRSPFDFTAFMIDLDWDGVSHGEPFEKGGLRTCSLGTLKLENVHVPDDHIIGRPGSGMAVLKESIGWERVLLMAVCTGPMTRVLEETIKFVKEREQFGKPIAKFQQISSKIAEMITRQRVSRQFLYDLAGQLDGKGGMIGNHLQDVAIAKLYITESYIDFMRDATQIWGGRGVIRDFPIEQDMRDALSSTIWAGTSETLRNTIAKLSGVR